MICQHLINIGNLGYRRIAPKFFKVIELASFGKKYMDKRVAIIYHNPLGILIAVIIVGLNIGFFLQRLANAIGDRTHLHSRLPLTDYEAICCRPFYFFKIYYCNFFTLAILYSLDNEFSNIFCFVHQIVVNNNYKDSGNFAIKRNKYL